MSLNGANELFRKLRAIDAVLENPEQVLGKAAETIRSGCVLECPVEEKNGGELRNSIKTRVEGDKGYVYTTRHMPNMSNSEQVEKVLQTMLEYLHMHILLILWSLGGFLKISYLRVR